MSTEISTFTRQGAYGLPAPTGSAPWGPLACSARQFHCVPVKECRRIRSVGGGCPSGAPTSRTWTAVEAPSGHEHDVPTPVGGCPSPTANGKIKRAGPGWTIGFLLASVVMPVTGYPTSTGHGSTPSPVSTLLLATSDRASGLFRPDDPGAAPGSTAGGSLHPVGRWLHPVADRSGRIPRKRPLHAAPRR